LFTVSLFTTEPTYFTSRYPLKQSKKEEEALPSLSLVLGFMAVRELGRLEDRVKVLARLGYGNAEIARICDTTRDSVRALKSKPKRKEKK